MKTSFEYSCYTSLWDFRILPHSSWDLWSFWILFG